MSDNYFANFPLITYNGTTTRNITERVSIDVTRHPAAAPTIYYPYDLKNNLRADNVADYYYGSPYVDWVIYLANGILDPYYDWYLYPDQFEQFIIQKYGSIATAQQKVAYFRNNWADDTVNISVSFYNAMPPNVQKYYVPVFSAKQVIQAYCRRQADWTVNTNKICQIDASLSDPTTEFANNEMISIYDNGQNLTGTCQLIGQTGPLLSVQHVLGNTNVTYTLVGSVSNTIATIETVAIIQQPIANDEYSFWQPVYFYDWENERNEKNKSIYLLDSNHLLPVIQDISGKLKQ